MTNRDIRHVTWTAHESLIWWRWSTRLCFLILLSALGCGVAGAPEKGVVLAVLAWGLHRLLRWGLTGR
jgi:hypothetical protein